MDQGCALLKTLLLITAQYQTLGPRGLKVGHFFLYFFHRFSVLYFMSMINAMCDKFKVKVKVMVRVKVKVKIKIKLKVK